MTTTAQATPVTIRATIKGIEDKGQSKVIRIEETNFLYYAWDLKVVEHLTVGQVVGLTVEEKPGKDGKGVFRHIKGIAEAPGRQPTGDTPRPPVPIGRGISAAGTGLTDPRGDSIERQVALKAAVELAGYYIGAGKETSSQDITRVASHFAAWLKGKEV